jgi:tungstate transport system ATP-binding protein
MIEEIRAIDIRKSYNGIFTLYCSLTLSAGPVYALLGPNGSGKSTLLKILALLDRPHSGNIHVRENTTLYVDPFDSLELRRKFLLVPTKTVLFNDTVFNNVAYGLKIRKMKKRTIKQKTEEALEKVNLLHLAYTKAYKLSSGEAQRLSVARAIALKPDVLLLDEPTVSLDPENTSIIEQIILDFARESHRIILLVTHNIFQAKRLSEEVIFIYKGEILEQASTGEFFKNPKTDIASKFIAGEVY